MIKKLFLIIISIFIVAMPLFSEEVFHQSIINASYLSDFAFGTFPVSLWGDFGVTGVEILPDMQTRIYATMKAGLLERTLRQNPVSGDILENTNYRYSVVFSDGEIVFDQELAKNPQTKSKMLSAYVSARMRWEQAFATISDIRDERYGGIFDPSVGLFPTGGDVFLKGTPELSGDKYFMAASVNLGLSYYGGWDSFYGKNSYTISTSINFAPPWLFNDLWFIDKVYTDAAKLNLNGVWNINFADAKTAGGRKRYSLNLSTKLSSDFLFGSSIPRYMLDRSFMGHYVVTRNFYASASTRLDFKGPEILIEGTYPMLYAYAENAINWGSILNAVDTKDSSFEFYGGIGCGADFYFLKYFNFFAEMKYIYTENEYLDRGLDFSMGVYVNLFI